MRMTRASRSTLVTMRSYGISTDPRSRVDVERESLRQLVRVRRRSRRPRPTRARRACPAVRARRPRPRRAARARRREASRKRSRQVSAALRSAISLEVHDEAALERASTRDRAARARFLAGSPDAVPAMTRRPGAKTASGASVIASTTRSPRMPCALRTRPTMISSGRAMSRVGRCGRPYSRAPALAPRRLRRRARTPARRRVQLAAEARLVPRLEHAGLAEQRAHGVGGLRAVVEPVVRRDRS